MAIYSSILAWKVPWTEEPGEVQFTKPGTELGSPACSAGDVSSIPASGRSPGEGHGNPLQYSCLENPMDRGAWWATARDPVEVAGPLGTPLGLVLRLFSSCSEQGLLSSWGAWASHCGGFSCCRAQALGLSGFSSCGA